MIVWEKKINRLSMLGRLIVRTGSALLSYKRKKWGKNSSFPSFPSFHSKSFIFSISFIRASPLSTSHFLPYSMIWGPPGLSVIILFYIGSRDKLWQGDKKLLLVSGHVHKRKAWQCAETSWVKTKGSFTFNSKCKACLLFLVLIEQIVHS